MGNTILSPNKNENVDSLLIKDLEFIVANYIATQNFQDMKNLTDIEYCNNLVIMTTDIIANKLNHLEVKYLAQRLKDGIEINEMTSDKVIYIQKKDIDTLDIDDEATKKRLCNGIAKFYVKVAHLFGAILTTVNPVYIYKDIYGQSIEIGLLNKKLLPKDVNASIKRNNLCTARLNALVNAQDINVANDAKVTIHPKFCDMNYNKTQNSVRNLNEEPGIPELEKLYFDIYDYESGGFTGMSKTMRKDVYEKDVIEFYKAFTGNKNVQIDASGESKIKKFADIPLRDYHKSDGCKNGGPYTKSYTASFKNSLFNEYAEHIKSMMKTTTSTHDKLLEKLKSLFSNAINQTSGKKEIIINPDLTDISLQKLVDEVRSIIIRLYVTCERDFNKGLEIFEAIVEKQIMNTSKKRIEMLQTTIQDSIIDNSGLQETNLNRTEDSTSNQVKAIIPDQPETNQPNVEPIARSQSGGRIQQAYNHYKFEGSLVDFE